MEQDFLKSAWQGTTTETKGQVELNKMIREKTHPVLKGIRKQLIIEIVAFTIFLIIYYDFFDGDKKPWWINVLLVTAMCFVILHNLIGYWLTKRRLKGHNIILSLEDQLKKMKAYAVVFVITRTLAATCLLIYFSSVVVFNTFKYWILIAIVITLIFQLSILSKLWWRRIRGLKKIIDSFSE